MFSIFYVVNSSRRSSNYFRPDFSLMTKRAIIPVLLMSCLAVLWSCASVGASSKALYFEAEACYRTLQKQPEKQKYRSYWLQCIRKFESVYETDPGGPWASAGLYMTGRMYQELYRYSYKPADLAKAETVFRTVVREFPTSAYRKKAQSELTAIAAQGVDTGRSEKARQQYFEAEAAFNELRAAPDKQKYRVYWMNCIRLFENVRQTDPDGAWAAAGHFMTGEMYRELYQHSYKPADLAKAEEIFRQVAAEYPTSAYREKAEAALDKKAPDKYTDVNKDKEDVLRDLTGGDTTSGEMTTSDAGKTGVAGEAAKITGVRYWSNPEYTRIVIDVNRETSFQNNLLNKDPSNNQPHQRLYVDLKNSLLGENIQRTIPIDDSLLKDVRAAQYSKETVRVVVDIKSFENYNIFSLKNPFRIVIDVRGDSRQTASAGSTSPPIEWGTETASIARQLALGVHRIVIDPGHGGKDYGAPGFVSGVHEKHVVLDISKRLAARIRNELGCEVLMTRNDDTYLTLEERTAIANTQKADLFISIHANASRNREAYGIETYFLNLTTDNESIAVAARENATSEKNISELQTILNDLMHNAKVNESSRLATSVQSILCSQLETGFSRIRNKGVKQAPFYVLLGAQMPAILIETAFISNDRECRRLSSPEYQEALCSGIIDGIRQYIKATRPSSFVSVDNPGG